ncbi:predicted protein [Histoplasma capsulatum H143]|uniref:Uncharacterized protein n=1 Tax=Ajellomyces capsulatus (strain H143) TaxID=544712 RepID=C6HAS3_AJECH|nr:predicted protein [Histoplasma capsulatum H143]
MAGTTMQELVQFLLKLAGSLAPFISPSSSCRLHKYDAVNENVVQTKGLRVLPAVARIEEDRLHGEFLLPYIYVLFSWIKKFACRGGRGARAKKRRGATKAKGNSRKVRANASRGG